MENSRGTTYIRMMVDVLMKKETYLSKLFDATMEQASLLKASNFDETASGFR